MKLAYLVTYEAYRLGAIRKHSKLYQSESQIVDGDSFNAMRDSISRNAVSIGEADSIDGVVITGVSLLNPTAPVELPESTQGCDTAYKLPDIASLHADTGESLAMLKDIEGIMYRTSSYQTMTAMGKVAAILQRLSEVANKGRDEYVDKLEAAFIDVQDALSVVVQMVATGEEIKLDSVRGVVERNEFLYGTCKSNHGI